MIHGFCNVLLSGRLAKVSLTLDSYMCQILLWLCTGRLFADISLQGGIQFACLFVSYSIHFLDFLLKGILFQLLYVSSFTE